MRALRPQARDDRVTAVVIRRSAAAFVLFALVASSCSQSDTDSANWLANTQEQTYVEVPGAFKRFTVNPFRVNKFDRQAERVSGIPRNPANWEVVFDSAKKPRVDNFDNPRPTAMVGSVAVYALEEDWTRSPNFRDALSVSTLRTYPLGREGGLDPIAAFNSGDPDVEVVNYSETAEKNGIRGIKVRFNQRISGSQWLTVDQQAFTNRKTNKVYVLTLKCSSTCFKSQYATAKKISSSFTVQK